MDKLKEYGIILKGYVKKRVPQKEIGTLTFSFYWENISDLNSQAEKILLGINTMELGAEFEYSYEELEKIADDLIAGKDVVLD